VFIRGAGTAQLGGSGTAHRRFAALGATVTLVAAAALGACGGGNGGSGGGASAKCDADYAKAQIEKHKKLPTFAPPGPAFDASKARGKVVFNIQETSANPFTQTITKAMREVAGKYGIRIVDYPNQGQRTQWSQGMQQAIAQKVDLITLVGGTISPSYFRPQAAAAARAGIPTVTVLNEDLSQPKGYKVNGRVAQPYAESARLDADHVIADTNCKADVLVLTSKEVIGGSAEVEALKDEVTKHCGDGCKLQFADAPVPEWSSKVQSEVQSAIQANPKLNYVIPLYDGMTQFVVPGIQAAGARGRVKVATFNGTPFALKFIQDDTPVVMDVGENLDHVGYATMDQAMRIFAGKKPIASGDEHIPLRVFDKSNVDEAGKPPELSKGYGDAYRKGYTQLWSGK
jgi:ribose transport system substrate-binding protein